MSMAILLPVEPAHKKGRVEFEDSSTNLMAKEGIPRQSLLLGGMETRKMSDVRSKSDRR